MLEEITLKNFQSHRHTRLKLGRVTVITGQSDVGKTAVIRSIRWLAQNRPSGTAFIHHGASLAKVTLRVDGHEISRRRGDGINSYILDGQTLKAFGQDVPPQITSILNLGPANWQAQHDPPFWFSDSAGEVSRALNTVINLGVIDYVLGHLAAAVRREQAGLEGAEGEVKAAQEARLAGKGAKAADVTLQGLEGAWDGLEADKAQMARGVALAGEGVFSRTTAEDAAKRAEMALAGIVAGEVWVGAAERYAKLAGLVGEGHGLLAMLQKRVGDGAALARLERLAGKVWDGVARLERLAGLIAEAKNARQRGRKAIVLERESEGEFTKLIGKSCPLCNQPIR